MTAQESYDLRLASMLHRYEDRMMAAKRDFDNEVAYAKESLRKEQEEEDKQKEK